MNLKRNKSTVIGALAVAVSSIFWGLDGILLTPHLFNLDVSFVVFILHFLPFMIMNLFLYKRYKYLNQLSKIDYISLFLVALLGGALGTFAIVKALFLVNFQSLSIVVLLQKLQPVFAILLAAVFLKEKLQKHFLLWASIALVAGYFLSFGFSIPHISQNNNTALASLYAIFAAFSFGSSTVFSKKILQNLDFVTATFYRYGMTSLIMFVIVLLTGHLFDFKSATPDNWLIIIVIAITTGSGAIFLYYYGLKKIPAIVATIMELFFPISAVLFDYIFNNHTLNLVQWLSAIVMIAAIVKINLDTVRAS